MKRAYVDTPEGQIHYQIEGSGKPLVLLHQGGFTSDEFLKVMPILSKHYRVIARDMLGYGMSDPNPPDYEIEDYARADINFLNALGIIKTSFVGVHTGASIAVEIAAAHPEVVDKLVLFGTPSFPPDVREACIKSYTFSPVEIKEDGSHFTLRFWKAARKFGPLATPEVLNMVTIASAMATGGAFHGQHAAFLHNTKERLPLIKSPALLISGSEDKLHSRHEAVKSLIPQCQVKIIEGIDDFGVLEKPDEFAQAVLDFLKNPGI